MYQHNSNEYIQQQIILTISELDWVSFAMFTWFILCTDPPELQLSVDGYLEFSRILDLSSACILHNKGNYDKDLLCVHLSIDDTKSGN